MGLHRVWHRVLGGIALGLSSLFAAMALGDAPVLVTNTASFQKAVKDGAEIIELASGEYDLRITGPDLPTVIRSQDLQNAAVIRTLALSGANGLTLESLVFDYDYDAADKISVAPFQISNSQNLTIRGSRFDGDRARDRTPIDNGYGFGSGLRITGSKHVVVQNNLFVDWYRAAIFRDIQFLTVRGNEVTQSRMDGFLFPQVDTVLIEANHFHNFNRSINSKDHADMIQFWTNKTDWASRNITIRGNLLNSGQGYFTQSIFMRNDQVDRGLKGKEMFYQNIRIEDNIILNGHTHGITLGATDGVVLKNNTLVQNPKAVGPDPRLKRWVPKISVAPNSENVDISGNLASRIVGYAGQKDWTVTQNLPVQNHSLLEPGHYSRVFEGGLGGDLSDPRSYRLIPTSEPAQLAIGAPALR